MRVSQQPNSSGTPSEALEILVFDNGWDTSRSALLSALSQRRGVTVRTLAEPFNWSRFDAAHRAGLRQHIFTCLTEPSVNPGDNVRARKVEVGRRFSLQRSDLAVANVIDKSPCKFAPRKP